MVAKASAKPVRTREVIGGLEDVLRPAFPDAVKFEAIGQPHTLTITTAKTVQDQDFKTKKAVTWPDGSPKMVLVLVGTYNGTDEERSIWVKGKRMTDAFRAALVEAGITGIAPGDDITVTWTGEEDVLDDKGKKMPNTDPAKLYAVDITV